MKHPLVMVWYVNPCYSPCLLGGCNVQCLCELPESYEAYRKQQHRWHSGPMQLFRLCLPDIIRSKVCKSSLKLSSISLSAFAVALALQLPQLFARSVFEFHVLLSNC